MTTRSVYQTPSPQTRQIVEELRGGSTYGTIASAYGISRQRVAQIAKRHGLMRKTMVKRNGKVTIRGCHVEIINADGSKFQVGGQT